MISGNRRPSVVLLGALLLFFLPFVDVSCQGRHVVSFTGIQLVTGTTVQQPRLDGPPKAKRIPGEPAALMSLAFGAVAAALSFARVRRVLVASSLASGAGALSLLVLKVRVDDDILSEGQGVLQVQYSWAYWLALLLFASGCVLAGRLVTRRVQASPAMPDPRDATTVPG